MKVFALSFAMGVVSGITMSFQFGTNWPGYMNKVGNVAGPLLYEVLTAFFLEATFLGVMLFGMNRVSGRVHLASGVIVAAGTTLSAFWILALNSWMQTPAGHVVQDGVLIAGNWLDVIFNPSFPYRLVHMLLASAITAVFLVAGLSAWRLLKAATDASAGKTLRFAVRLAALLVPAAGRGGRPPRVEHPRAPAGENRRRRGAVGDAEGAPLTLFAIIDEDRKRNDYAVEIPQALSSSSPTIVTASSSDWRSSATITRRSRRCSGRSASWSASAWRCSFSPGLGFTS